MRSATETALIARIKRLKASADLSDRILSDDLSTVLKLARGIRAICRVPRAFGRPSSRDLAKSEFRETIRGLI